MTLHYTIFVQRSIDNNVKSSILKKRLVFSGEMLDMAHHAFARQCATENKCRIGRGGDVLETNKVGRIEKKGRSHVVVVTIYLLQIRKSR